MVSSLGSPSGFASHGSSFPQPDDVEDDTDEDEVNTNTPSSSQLLMQHSGSKPHSQELAGHQTGSSGKSKPRARFKDRTETKASTSDSVASFVTARTMPIVKDKPNSTEENQIISPPPPSFVTAKEPTESKIPHQATRNESGNLSPQQPSPIDDSSSQRLNSTSTTSLLSHGRKVAADDTHGLSNDKQRRSVNESQGTQNSPGVESNDGNRNTGSGTAIVSDLEGSSAKQKHNAGLVRFNIPDEEAPDEERKRTKRFHASRRRSWRRRAGQHTPGQIVKAEKMLVRIDLTQQDLDADYDENQSMKVETRTLEKWEEFVVVCRESNDEDEGEYHLQLYKTRVIPAIEKANDRKKIAYQVPLDRKKTRINLYSSLDKTLVVWTTWKSGKAIFILRTRSAANSVEWYTFLRSVLGWKRSANLQINVPDLNVQLSLDDPFVGIENSDDVAKAAKGDEAATARTIEAEKAVAGSIIKHCVQMLQDSPEWGDVIDAWLRNGKMGLAWKRYDRLEWVYGANEQKMYGSLAMQKSHDLELRPKQHYPTSVKDQEILEEPPPIEGFLIRLTTQKGRSQRFGKMFFKRLYFTTHNHYLCYCRPAKAMPPPPPTLALDERRNIPSATQIVEHTPLIYAVNPFPLKDSAVEWLQHKADGPKHRHDHEAFQESERKVNTMLQAEGYINLIHVARVRHVKRGATPVDQNIDSGSDVDFHQEVDDTRREDGKADTLDDDRTFELVLKNGLVVRLQAYNEQTKDEWIKRLRKLVKYWKLRILDDMSLFRSTRDANLKYLRIDEEMESIIGQFAQKWEVKPSVASPQLHNMCGISSCRAITIAGTLYYKPRRHTTFQRCGVILCHGQLLVFHGTLRDRSGKEVPHIQHERLASIDLKECYIYSGLITEGDLLYQNRTFNSNHPGHHALPKIWLNDGWTSTDEDTMTTFVIWQPRKRNFFRALEQEEGEGKRGRAKAKLRYVSQLGAPGRSIVFKTRSRAGRDHWVMSIAMEIERLQKGEDLRIVEKE